MTGGRVNGWLANGLELSKILRPLQDKVPRRWWETARQMRAARLLFSRTPVCQAPHTVGQPAGSAEGPGVLPGSKTAEGPGDLPGLQQVVAQRHRASNASHTLNGSRG